MYIPIKPTILGWCPDRCQDPCDNLTHAGVGLTGWGRVKYEVNLNLNKYSDPYQNSGSMKRTEFQPASNGSTPQLFTECQKEQTKDRNTTKDIQTYKERGKTKDRTHKDRQTHKD